MAESLKKPKKMSLHVLVFYKTIVLAFKKKNILHAFLGFIKQFIKFIGT